MDEEENKIFLPGLTAAATANIDRFAVYDTLDLSHGFTFLWVFTEMRISGDDSLVD